MPWIRGFLVISALFALFNFLYELYTPTSISFMFGSLVLYCVLSVINYGKIIYILKPSYILTIYYSVNYVLGFWALENDYIYKVESTLLYSNYEHIYFSIDITYITLFMILFVTSFYHKSFLLKNITATIDNRFRNINIKKVILLLILIFFITSILTTFVSSQGGIIMVPRYAISILGALYFLINKKFKTFFIYSIIIIIVMSLTQFDSKREIIFIVLMLYFFYMLYSKKSALNQLFGFFIVTIIGFYLIIVMSIARGFGGYEAEGVFDSVSYVSDYLDNENNIRLIMNNMEVTTLFIHSINGTNYGFQKEPSLNMISRTGLLIIPSRFLPFKPPSFIEEYTSFYNPDFRSQGRSTASGAISEFIWSFGVLFFFMIIGFYYLMDWIFYNFLNHKHIVLWLFFIVFHFAYLRGSGLDLYLQYTILYLLSYKSFYELSKK